MFQKNNSSAFESNLATEEEESSIETPTSPALKCEPFFHSLEECLERNEPVCSFSYDHQHESMELQK